MKTIIFSLIFYFSLQAQNGVTYLILMGDDASFAPTDLSGLVLWLDASNTSSLTLAGSNVTTWADLAGSNDGTQSDANKKPVYNATGLNSLPTVNFQFGIDGTTADVLEMPDFLTGLTSGEIFFVLKTENDPGGGGSQGNLLNFDGITSAVYYPFVNGDTYLNFISDTRQATGNPTLALTTAHILNMQSASGNFTVNINDTEQFTTGTNTVATTATPLLGGYSALNTFDGYISEVIMFNRVLTAPERTQIKDYLKAKWSLIY